MRKSDFNENWYYRHLDVNEEGKKITLPHDAMCHEMRSMDSRGRHNIGWFEGCDYVYWKNFDAPAEYEGSRLVLEFEGVYHNAEVYVNGQKAAFRPYGYTNFYVDISKMVNYGEENEICVITHNSDQPNSRWYTGSGIYRPVWLYIGKENFVDINGVKIRTLEYDQKSDTAYIGIKVNAVGVEQIEISIEDPRGEQVYSGKLLYNSEENSHSNTGSDRSAEEKASAENGSLIRTRKVKLANPALWSVDTPQLYTCIVRCGEDEVRERFGVRTLTWTTDNGIAINGEHVILKGACIHHDNGVLGACAFPEAEERKIKILKETGYNAVRCAHNPCSKALLDVCDRLGMLVMDEYTDMWYIHKNEYDYASYMKDWWQQDLRDMVEKDYNHPSVIMYSTGNEVAETGQREGIRLTGQMTRYLHKLDKTRPVTCGINIFFNFLYSMGFGVYSDEKAKKAAEQSDSKKKKTVGSEFYNTLAGLLGDKAMKLGATLHGCDVKTRDAYANMDIAGYNYGILRYKHDLKKYPDRLILGSETFCKDAYSFYELAKREKRIVGDFVWAGMDYIGEAGIGAWEYEDYAPAAGRECGWLTAGSGRINILGFANGEAAYTKVALEKEQGPFIAVKPVYQRGRHSPSAWKMTDAMESWSWRGCEGMSAVVEVYARAAEVELFLNGRSVGRKTLKDCCNTSFKVPYENGELTAVSYNARGAKIGSCTLRTASQNTVLTIKPEKALLNKKELGYIRLSYTDEAGILKPMEKHNIAIKVENGTLEGFGNACSYNESGYWKNTTKTYYGEALAVVRAGDGGSVKVAVTDETGEHFIELPVR